MNISELRKIRIANDYKDMCKLSNCSFISWKAIKGEAPYVEEYLLTINVKSYISPTEISEQHIIIITLPDKYPQASPCVIMKNPVLYHPHWYENGKWAFGRYQITDKLLTFVGRMIQDMQFNPIYINATDPSNHAAARWCISNPHLFPSDTKSI